MKLIAALLFCLMIPNASLAFTDDEEDLSQLRKSQWLQANPTLKELHDYWTNLAHVASTSSSRVRDPQLPQALPIPWRLNGASVKLFPENKNLLPKDSRDVVFISKYDRITANAALYETILPAVTWIRMHEVFAEHDFNFALPKQTKVALEKLQAERTKIAAILEDAEYYSPNAHTDQDLINHRAQLNHEISQTRELLTAKEAQLERARFDYNQQHANLTQSISLTVSDSDPRLQSLYYQARAGMSNARTIYEYNSWVGYNNQIVEAIQKDLAQKTQDMISSDPSLAAYSDRIKTLLNESTFIRGEIDRLRYQYQNLKASYQAYGKKLQKYFSELGYTSPVGSIREAVTAQLKHKLSLSNQLNPQGIDSRWKKLEATKTVILELKSKFTKANQQFTSKCHCVTSKIPELLTQAEYQNFREYYVSLSTALVSALQSLEIESFKAKNAFVPYDARIIGD